MELLDYLKVERGRASQLAAGLGVSPVLVSQWANKKRPPPAARCPDIEKLTGGLVTCEELQPEVDWGYLRGPESQPRRIDTPEAAAAVLGVGAEEPQPGHIEPNEPAEPDPDAGRVGPAEETA